MSPKNHLGNGNSPPKFPKKFGEHVTLILTVPSDSILTGSDGILVLFSVPLPLGVFSCDQLGLARYTIYTYSLNSSAICLRCFDARCRPCLLDSHNATIIQPTSRLHTQRLYLYYLLAGVFLLMHFSRLHVLPNIFLYCRIVFMSTQICCLL